GAISAGLMKGSLEGVQVTTMELCLSAIESSSLRVGVMSTSLLNSLQNLSNCALSISNANTFSILLTFINAFNEILPWFPHPQMVTTDASDRARYFAATPVAAPVLMMVISMESINASNRPLEAS